MIIIETIISNRTHGSESVMSCSSETTGDACIVVHVQHKFIIKGMQKEISERNQSNGSSQFANPAMNLGIVKK